MKRFALLLALTGALPACATWPEEGKGGFAERRAVADPVLESLADRFEYQRQRGAERFAAGLADEAKTAFVRAQRNHSAGILDDFAVDLANLQMLLDRIERHIPGR
jgi:hypothetical protein